MRKHPFILNLLFCFSLDSKIMPQEEQFEKALEIATKHKITIYDALFIALATNTNQPLITSDRKQAETSKKCGVIATLV